MAKPAHNKGRAEKYFKRPRHLYALHFSDGCVYIGQTVDMRKREQQHRSPRGGWHRSFTVIHLETVEGTRAQASEHEVAWRMIAHQAGHGVYAKPPGTLIRRHGAYLTPFSRQLIQSRRWPMKRARARACAWWAAAALAGLAILMWI